LFYSVITTAASFFSGQDSWYTNTLLQLSMAIGNVVLKVLNNKPTIGSLT